jgi:IS30 family transposase
MSNELTLYDRQKLQYWLRTKQSLRAIAAIMRKDHSVISREIKRNGSNRKKYRADTAQALADKRRHQKRRGKLDQNLALKTYVINRLEDDWSPEEIAGKLKLLSGSGTISHESIYRYIYSHSNKGERLFLCLPQRRPKRRKWGGRKHRKILIPQRISIKCRPEIVNERKRYGDWESDNLEFKRTITKGAVSVQVERKSGLVRIHKVAGKKSPDDTLNALFKTRESVPEELFKTITFDNGVENYHHRQLDVDTYFCKPFASWQKGSVENVNKLLRRYLPRNTDFDALTDHDIHIIQEKLNSRPRKRLNYQTPNEVINGYLGGALIT